MRREFVIFIFLLLALTKVDSAPTDDETISISVRADDGVLGSTALDNFPLIDGHNDLPYNLFGKLRNQIQNFSFENDLSNDTIFGFQNCDSCFTDLPRIRNGKLGAQFWVSYVGCSWNDSMILAQSFEQIDVIRRLIDKYPNDLEFVTTADGIVDAFNNKKIASLIGLEGGHSIDSRLSLLRQYYDLGVRYMTLTHSCNLPWADASPVDDGGVIAGVVNLTEFGRRVVLEMNRLGMMVDLSHVSHNVMSEAIDVSKAPVIFSHSSAYSVYAHHRNVRNDVLEKLVTNRGIIMVNFYSAFIGSGNVTINNVVDHINYIVNVTGFDHIGIGADYDGVSSVPVGLEDVSKYKDLFDLLKQLDPIRWTIENLEKLAGRNLYRVFKEVEAVKNELSQEKPNESLISDVDGEPTGGTISYYGVQPLSIIIMVLWVYF